MKVCQHFFKKQEKSFNHAHIFKIKTINQFINY